MAHARGRGWLSNGLAVVIRGVVAGKILFPGHRGIFPLSMIWGRREASTGINFSWIVHQSSLSSSALC